MYYTLVINSYGQPCVAVSKDFTVISEAIKELLDEDKEVSFIVRYENLYE